MQFIHFCHLGSIEGLDNINENGFEKSDRLLAIEDRCVDRGVERGEKVESKWDEKKSNHPHTAAVSCGVGQYIQDVF